MDNQLIIAYFLKYFWVLAGSVNALHLLFILMRISAKGNTISKASVVTRYMSLFILPCFLLATVQMFGGYNNPMYFLSKEKDQFVMISWLILGFTYIGTIYWLNFKNGYQELKDLSMFRLNWIDSVVEEFHIIMYVTFPALVILAIHSDLYKPIEYQIYLLLK